MNPALDHATALLTMSVFLSKTLMHFSYGLWFETKIEIKIAQIRVKLSPITDSKSYSQDPRNEFQPLLQVNPSDKPAKMANIFIFVVFSLSGTINEKSP